MEIQGSLEKAFATFLRTLGRRRCGVHSFGHPCVQNDTTHITLESGFKSLHFKIVCLDTAQEILRKHEKTTYSVGLSPVTPAHTCRGPSKDKHVNCAVADSKAKLVAFGYLHPHFVYDNLQQRKTNL